MANTNGFLYFVISGTIGAISFLIFYSLFLVKNRDVLNELSSFDLLLFYAGGIIGFFLFTGGIAFILLPICTLVVLINLIRGKRPFSFVP